MGSNSVLYCIYLDLNIVSGGPDGVKHCIVLYCTVLYLHLFSNMGDKTHPFTMSLYDTFMQKVRVETAYRNKSTTKIGYRLW